MTTKLLVEKLIVTFAEAAVSYAAINQTHLTHDTKVVAIGALGAGLSAVYNLLRESNPTMPQSTVEPIDAASLTPVVAPEESTVITPTEPVVTP